MRLKITAIILSFLFIPFIAMADGLTKKELFDGLGQEVINRIVTNDFVRNPSVEPQIKLGSFFELDTPKGSFNSHDTVQTILQNSYSADLNQCGGTAGGNYVMFFYSKLDKIHKYYSAKHFCGVFGSGCDSIPEQSTMITHDTGEMGTIENECSALASLYKDYETYIDGVIKKSYETAKEVIAEEQQKQEDKRLVEQQRKEDLRRQAEEKKQRQAERERVRKEEAKQLALEHQRQRERDNAAIAQAQKDNAERARKKREDDARQREERKQALKSGQIPVKTLDDAVLFYDALDHVEGYKIVAQTPLKPDNRTYVIGGVITRVSKTKSGRMVYSAQAGKNEKDRFHFQFKSQETESKADLRRNAYTTFVGKFINLNSIGEPVFEMYYCE